MQTIKHLAVLATVALLGASVNAIDVNGEGCSCVALQSTTKIIADVSASRQFSPVGCAIKGEEGVSYVCTFEKPTDAKAGTLAAGVNALCRFDRWGQWQCIPY